MNPQVFFSKTLRHASELENEFLSNRFSMAEHFQENYLVSSFGLVQCLHLTDMPSMQITNDLKDSFSILI